MDPARSETGVRIIEHPDVELDGRINGLGGNLFLPFTLRSLPRQIEGARLGLAHVIGLGSPAVSKSSSGPSDHRRMASIESKRPLDWETGTLTIHSLCDERYHRSQGRPTHWSPREVVFRGSHTFSHALNGLRTRGHGGRSFILPRFVPCLADRTEASTR
jgi:hypothetical protein